jgi:hypothetical protein
VIVFICSPHVGILDNWLPVLSELKRRQPNVPIVAVIPDPSQAESLASDSPLVAIAARTFDSTYFKTPQGEWRESDRFNRLSLGSQLRTGLLRAGERLARSPLNRTIAGRFQVSERTSSAITRLSNSKAFRNGTQLISRGVRMSRSTSLVTLAGTGNVICYCLSSEFKKSTREVLDVVEGNPRLSMYHGGINTRVPDFRKQLEGASLDGIRSFLVNESEREALRDRFGLPDNAMQVVGMARHDPGWITSVRSASESLHKLPWKRYALLISRPADEHGLPLERKYLALEDIRTEVIEGLGLPLLIKLHPKQRGDDPIYRTIFGRASYGTTWAYTRAHAFHLARGCDFSISFGSAIDIDMVAAGVPAIDRRDRRGLAAYDFPGVARDSRGRILDGLAAAGLVLVAESTQDLKDHLESIRVSRATVIAKLRGNYDAAFPDAHRAIEEILNAITEAQRV